MIIFLIHTRSGCGLILNNKFHSLSLHFVLSVSVEVVQTEYV